MIPAAACLLVMPLLVVTVIVSSNWLFCIAVARPPHPLGRLAFSYVYRPYIFCWTAHRTVLSGLRSLRDQIRNLEVQAHIVIRERSSAAARSRVPRHDLDKMDKADVTDRIAVAGLINGS